MSHQNIFDSSLPYVVLTSSRSYNTPETISAQASFSLSQKRLSVCHVKYSACFSANQQTIVKVEDPFNFVQAETVLNRRCQASVKQALSVKLGLGFSVCVQRRQVCVCLPECGSSARRNVIRHYSNPHDTHVAGSTLYRLTLFNVGGLPLV